jgi:hypothetical protein
MTMLPNDPIERRARELAAQRSLALFVTSGKYFLHNVGSGISVYEANDLDEALAYLEGRFGPPLSSASPISRA